MDREQQLAAETLRILNASATIRFSELSNGVEVSNWLHGKINPPVPREVVSEEELDAG